MVTTLVGDGLTASNTAINGTGTNVFLVHPTGVAVDSSGMVYVAESGSNVLRMMDGSGAFIPTLTFLFPSRSNVYIARICDDVGRNVRK